ncbi:hypothetical protein DOY81_013965 [Sarcophaga bullata]|nr:hypothetical protein DOY81_013965 [Sarcophaga bullata]
MKFLLRFCLLLLLATLIASKSVRFGKRTQGDIPLYSEDVVRLPKKSVQEYTLTYPPTGIKRKIKLTAIEVYDYIPDNNGADAQLIEPKPNEPFSKSATILLKRSIKTTVQFFGFMNMTQDKKSEL